MHPIDPRPRHFRSPTGRAPAWVRRLAIPLLVMVVGVATGCQSTPAPLVFQPAELPDAQQGVAYEARIDIDANVTDVNQFVIRGGALPPGLTAEKIHSETSAGRISGIPEAAGSF